jgi:AcrR family transcriptional regulator
MIVHSIKEAVSERTFVSDVPSGKYCALMNSFSCMFVGMTNSPTTHEWPPGPSSEDQAALTESVLVAGTETSEVETRYENIVTTPIDPRLVDQSGRPLGPRALRTRARILEATIGLLENTSMRDLRVIDIARTIGSSPATFYQYFKDVNDVVLELATEISEFTPEMIEMIDGDWTGPGGHERGVRLANLVIDHWDQYKAILRVRNNAADEGDPAFRAVRLKAMLPMVTAFSKVIAATHEAAQSEEAADLDSEAGKILPLSGAMFMFTALESTAIHHEVFTKRFGPMGEGRDALIETISTILQSTLTSKH